MALTVKVPVPTALEPFFVCLDGSFENIASAHFFRNLEKIQTADFKLPPGVKLSGNFQEALESDPLNILSMMQRGFQHYSFRLDRLTLSNYPYHGKGIGGSDSSLT